jgi:HPt (histidine-containing phosphotransfer) domain-containing protein
LKNKENYTPSSQEETNSRSIDTALSLAQDIKNTLIELTGEESPEIIQELAETYKDDAAKLVEEIYAAIAQNDARILAQAAHTLKSSSGNLGAHHLAELALILEKQGKNGDITRAPEYLDQLKNEYATVLLALDHL